MGTRCVWPPLSAHTAMPPMELAVPMHSRQPSPQFCRRSLPAIGGRASAVSACIVPFYVFGYATHILAASLPEGRIDIRFPQGRCFSHLPGNTSRMRPAPGPPF